MSEKVHHILNWDDITVTFSIPKGKRFIIVSTDRLAEFLKQEQWNGHFPDSVNVEELVQEIARKL